MLQSRVCLTHPRRSPPGSRQVGLKAEFSDTSGGRAKQREWSQPSASEAANGCAKKLQDGQWNEKPSPMSIGQVRKAVQEGKELPGNIVCTDKPEMLAELKALWKAHAMQTPCTVAVVVPESGQGVRTVSVWWQPSRVPELVRIKVHQLATKPGPIPKEPINAKISSIKSPSKCTVRILAPEQYRCMYSANGAQDKPEMVISELASKAGVQAAISGHRGLFVCRLQKPPQQVVAWIKKGKDEDDETYFRRVQGLASAQKKPMAFRQGGGSDLGVCGGAREAETKPKIRTWVLHWAPDAWTQVRVEEFLKAPGWTDVTTLTRRKAWKRREPHQWVFRAAPADVTSDLNVTFTYADGDKTLTVTMENVRKQRGRNGVPVSGPKKQWVDKTPAVAEVLPTQLDAESQGMDVDSKTGTKRCTEDAEAAAAAKRRGNSETAGTAPASSPDRPTAKLVGSDVEETEELRLLLNEAPGWKVRECGGAGECAFLAVASAIAWLQGKSLDEAALGREAATLRLLAVAHMSKHKEIFRELGTGSGRERNDDCRSPCAAKFQAVP